MTVKEAVNVRKSVRSYTGEALEQDALDALLLAAKSAPVAMGKYENIHLTVIRNKELLDELDKNAAEFFGDSSIHPLYGAPALILISGPTSDRMSVPNAAFIIQTMALRAVELGLGQVDIYGAIAALGGKDALIEKLGLPEGFSPLAALAVGKSDETYTARDIPADRIGVNYVD